MSSPWRLTALLLALSCAHAKAPDRPATSPEFSRFVDDYFLMVFVNGRDADAAGDHDVGMTLGVTDLVDAFAGSEFFEFDLAGENGGFVVIEKGEERDIF